VGLVIGLLVIVAGVTVSWGWQLLTPGDPLDLKIAVPLTVLGIGGVLLRERDLGPHFGISVTSVVLAAAVALAGPVGAALVGAVSYLADLPSQRPRNRLFNAAMTGAMGAVGGVVYLLLAGGLATEANLREEALFEVAMPLSIAYAAMTLVNVMAIGLMAAAVRGSHVLTVAVGALRSLGWGSVSQLIIGFLFVVLWEGARLGPVSAFFVLGPLLVAHWTIGREALARREHQETVTSFVSALEQADPVSVGHSSRVADLADRMAGILDLGSQQAEDLRYASLLHDIGLVTVRAELPHDVEPDDISYLSVISGHPEAGVNVLKGMDFLTGALPAIAHHHERYDGRGYPAGLAGESIPLAARIIAVADAFDALTAAREGQSSHSAALAELRLRAGSQFDPVVVEALAEVLARAARQHEASAVPVGPVRVRDPYPASGASHGPRPETRWDHDHPSVSDSFAEWQPDSGARV
jgi:hypothetical protein